MQKQFYFKQFSFAWVQSLIVKKKKVYFRLFSLFKQFYFKQFSLVCVISWLVPRDFRYRRTGEAEADAEREAERTSVSSKTNFGRNTNSARLIILDGLYHLN